MCNAAQALYDQGFKIGIKQERINIIRKMIRKGYSKEKIIDFCEYTEEEYLGAESLLLVPAGN